MADIVITSVDFADGLKPKNLVVPSMKVDVVLKNPPADLQKAVKNDGIIVQKMAEAAFSVLKKARDDIRGAIEDLDETYSKKPPESEREAEDRVTTLNAMCKKVAQAQSDAASSAAEQEWTRQAKKNKDLTKFKVVFGLRLALGTISIAASVTAAVLSLGTLAITILGAAKTVAGIASDTYSFCRDIGKAEQDIIQTDAALAKSWTDKEVTKGKVARELAVALGVPFIKSIGSLQTLLNEYNSKNAKKDHAADAMWTRAKKLMTAIDGAGKTISNSKKAMLKNLGDVVTKLLDQIGDLVALSKSNDQFYDVYMARCETYKALQGGALGKTATATGVAVVLAGIASTANTVVDIAMKLA